MTQNLVALETALWSSADSLRGKMNASDYMNYLLGLVFFKHLSDKQLRYVGELTGHNLESLDALQEFYTEKERNEPEEYLEIISELKETYAFSLAPNQTFNYLLQQIQDSNFQLDMLQSVFQYIENSHPDLHGIFEDFDVTSSKLGTDQTQKNKTISEVMVSIGRIDTTLEGTVDNLGDVYEYLLGKFASDNNGGEFYTPKSVSDLMSRIVTLGQEGISGFKIADFTMGSGSLMLNAKKYMSDTVFRDIKYYGQELNGATYNLAKMNLILHGIPLSNQYLNHGDTLGTNWTLEGDDYEMNAVVMNPPYSLSWDASPHLLNDIRFQDFGVLPPKSKADLAFLLHGLSHLKDNGKMAIVLPHGVLFRGASEGKIRQKLLENGNIEAVIGLPSNIFFNTGIPTTILILSKSRKTKDVYFIDASQQFEKQKAQNIMLDEHVTHIFENYKELKEEDKFSRVVPFEEIEENEFNLNIPRYIDTFEEEPEISLGNLKEELVRVNQEIDEKEKELVGFMSEMIGDTDELNSELQDFIDLLGGIS